MGGSSELSRYFTPDERLFKTEAPVDGDQFRGIGSGVASDVGDDGGANGRITGQKAQGDHGMSFPTTHGLFKFEYSLIGLPGKGA